MFGKTFKIVPSLRIYSFYGGREMIGWTSIDTCRKIDGQLILVDAEID